MADFRVHLPNRVLMTADTVGGVWQYALDVARGLSTRGIEVVLAAMGGRASDAQRRMASDIPGLRLVDSDFRLEWMTDPWNDVREAGAWLLDIAADAKPDLVHLNNYAHGALAWERPVLMVGHSCVYSWFASVEGSVPPDEWRRYRVEVSRGLAAADAVTAPSGAMLRALRKHYGRFRPISPIHNGADAAAFTPGVKENLIFGAGRLWDSAKNLALLDSVASEVPWPVFLAGSTEHPDGGVASFRGARALGLLDRDGMRSWLGRAAVYALPARYEPFGLSVLEAALSGCALVLGDIASLREIWGDTAVFVDPNDPVALRGALNRLASDDKLRERLARRARARARRYTIEKMVAAYVTAYGALVGARPRVKWNSSVRRPQPAKRQPAVPATGTGK